MLIVFIWVGLRFPLTSVLSISIDAIMHNLISNFASSKLNNLKKGEILVLSKNIYNDTLKPPLNSHTEHLSENIQEIYNI